MCKYVVFTFLLLFCTSCFQYYSEEEENLRTVPITNNPNIVPSGSSGFPGFRT